ncbi:MAG: hypothetical protein GY926_19585 [bacterium]|nr:hypothetical protein [bacterium]
MTRTALPSSQGMRYVRPQAHWILSALAFTGSYRLHSMHKNAPGIMVKYASSLIAILQFAVHWAQRGRYVGDPLAIVCGDPAVPALALTRLLRFRAVQIPKQYR